MKIIGLANSSLLVEMSRDEFGLIVGNRHLYSDDLKVGTKFNVSKQWEAVEHAKLMVSHADSIERVYARALEAIQGLKLQDLEKPLEKE